MSPTSSAIGDALATLAAVFREAGLRWYVFGAQAAIVYGSARATKDIDVTVEAGSTPAAQLIALLLRDGFRARATDLEELALATRVVPLDHVATGTPVDVVLAGPGLEQLFLDNARETSVAGVRVPVAAAEDVITMKLLAARAHDIDDVVAMLRAGGSALDLHRVRGLLTMLEEALGQDDLLVSLDAAATRAR